MGVSTDPYCLELTSAGDLAIDADGQLKLDATIVSRCRIRLLTKRRVVENGVVISDGWWVDPDFGSRFHLLRTLKAARQNVQAFADEALKPLIDAGEILGVEVDIERLEVDHEWGMLKVPFAIIEPATNERVDIGALPLGRSA